MLKLKSVLNNKRNYFTFIDGNFYFSILSAKNSINESLKYKILNIETPYNSKQYTTLYNVDESVRGIGKNETAHLTINDIYILNGYGVASCLNELMEYNHYYIGTCLNYSYSKQTNNILLLNMNILDSIQAIKVNKSEGNITYMDGNVTNQLPKFKLNDGDHDIVCCKFDGYQDNYYFLLDESYITVDEIKTIIETRKIKMIAKGK